MERKKSDNYENKNKISNEQEKNCFKCQSSKINTKNMIKKDSIDNNDKILSNAFNKTYPDYPESIISQKSLGLVKSFASNSYKGLTKPINEDRVIIVSPIPKPQKTIHRSWPKMSYFGVFDGHGGETCSELLKTTFLNILVENKNFPHDIKLALSESFEKFDEEFYNQNKDKKNEQIDNSGSCALVLIVTENKIYIANVGDCRAIMSINNGNKVKQLTMDHKPNNIKEFERITKNGGKVYIDDDYKEDEHGKYNESELKYIVNKSDFELYKGQKEIVFRHFPSDLAVMRSMGDLKSKRKEFGGLPGNIIGVPEIFVYDYNAANDFIVMGCDGIYDDLSNEDIVKAIWYVFKNRVKERNYDLNLLTKDSCDVVLKYAMDLLTSDNLSCLVIGLEGIQKFLSLKKLKDKK